MKLTLLTYFFLIGANAFVLRPITFKARKTTASPRIEDLNGRLARRVCLSNSLSSDSIDDELHPNDPAKTTAQLMAAIWNQITQVALMEKGESSTVIYPHIAENFTPAYITRLMGHLDNCKDVCEHFGVRTNLVPYLEKEKVIGFTAKSYAGPEGADEELEFEYDPFWDDDEIGDYTGVDEEIEGKPSQDKYAEIVNKIPDDDDEIISITKTWVSKFMSDMGICPFTSGADLAGLPMGKVFYTIDRCSGIEEVYARYWNEVVRVEASSEKELSTTLLICPEFCMDHVEYFENFSSTLTQSLTGIGMEDLLQLVFFHPNWTFRDGSDRFGEGAAANYARRSPWPMINILRTNQVRKAQKGIPTGLVYTQNEKTLTKIGVEELENMLRLRSWNKIEHVKVDRKDREALRVAQDFQETGVVKSVDLSFDGDAVPAANKVDSTEVEEGNLINVMRQALGKRLGLNEEHKVLTRLNGPETSAAIMASDFLLTELDTLIAEKETKPST
mmetsp:Transcript_28324/g.41844  ORF Transcript_28324/g.41844 Transcript_28324/m.41844 type:complete len:502 (-) Transcript_28324:1303-2808(-)